MTKAEQLLALAVRCEEATGAEQKIDAAIGRVLGIPAKAKNVYKRSHYPRILIRVDEKYPKFTASLDAAMTLLPQDPWVEVKGPRKYLNIPSPVPNKWSAHVTQWGHPDDAMGWAATPALALCAASLRAIAAMEA